MKSEKSEAKNMLAKRIIPCLDVKDGRVVKGTNFEGLRDMADPVELARMYNDSGADELVFYDITASAEGRSLFADVLRRVASEIFIPLTVGGGIRSPEDFDRALHCGADKVSVNSGAIENPALIGEAARKYGSQCVVLSMDVKRVNGSFRLFAKGGRVDTGLDAIEWAVRGVENGAGEIVLNSIDTDGVKNGFDLPMLDALAARVPVPIIASGGAGKPEDFAELFRHPGIDAGLAASIFHTRQVEIRELKEYLRTQGVEMRIERRREKIHGTEI
jgi:cyclase